jgi:hypothetical protein
MSSIVVSGDTSGTVTLSAPAVAGTNTITLPASTGTMMVSGNMPAFSVYLASNQSITSSTFTKITCQTEDFDTNSNYDNATNYRFTPTVAGYYQVSGSVSFQGSTSLTRFFATIYRNGSEYIRFNDFNAVNGYSSQGSCLIYCNGSTDYLELYSYATGAVIIAALGRNQTNFQAVMVRNA